MADEDDLADRQDVDDELSLPKGTLIVFTLTLQKVCLWQCPYHWLYTLKNLATVNKLIQELMPDGLACAKETRNVLADICVGM